MNSRIGAQAACWSAAGSAASRALAAGKLPADQRASGPRSEVH
jgi:hypothetical protein